jgi:hypothetical protein
MSIPRKKFRLSGPSQSDVHSRALEKNCKKQDVPEIEALAFAWYTPWYDENV